MLEKINVSGKKNSVRRKENKRRRRRRRNVGTDGYILRERKQCVINYERT